MRPHLALAFAFLLATPALAGADRLAVADVAAITEGIDAAEVKRVQTLFADALRQTGIEVVLPGKKAMQAEFVASLSLAKVGGDVVLTGQVSRMKLDQWAARVEARVQGGTADAVGAAVQDLAGQITLAMQTAPARSETQPATRPQARKLPQTR